MYSENRMIGTQGEKLAEQYLKENGYEIIDRNFYCRFGEIDIIAKYNEEVIFVEVKTRKQIRYGNAAESVTRIKQNHIYKASEMYIYLHNLYNVPISLDVIEVYLFDDKENRVEHIKNAIISDPYKTFRKRGWYEDKMYWWKF